MLWSIPDCKASYVADGACEGVPLLSPGRSTLAALLGDQLRFLDTATGASKGQSKPQASRACASLQTSFGRSIEPYP